VVWENDFAAIWDDKGIHDTVLIRDWLEEKLRGKSFRDIVTDDLKIVAANVTERCYVIYDKKGNLDKKISAAVNASLAIPLFFKPLVSDNMHLVDGGLLSNFPNFLFAQGKYPTLGLRLKDLEPPEKISSTWDYLKALLLTMTEAHDKERPTPPYFRSYVIAAPPHIPSTKFALDTRDVDELYNLGRAVGLTIPWKDNSSPTPRVSFYDPKPHETLEFSLFQATKLWENYTNRDLWVDEYTQESEFLVHIEPDWSVRYDRSGTVTVRGKASMFMSRFVVSVLREAGFANTSLSDVEHICEEITSVGLAVPLIHIPAFNDEDRKGFVMFYVPPIAEGQSERKFHTGFTVPQEFARTVKMGVPDSVGYVVRQLAKHHQFALKFKVLAEVSLPQLKLTPEFASTLAFTGTTFEKGANHSYNVYEAELGRMSVQGEVQFRTKIELAEK